MKRMNLCLLLGALCLLSACAMARTEAGRPADKELTLATEGGEETVPVTLWQEEGFSMYLPAEGWDREDGVWRPSDNGEVALFVQTYAERDSEAVREAIAGDYAGYGFLPPDGGTFTGYDAVASMTMWVKLVEGGGGGWFAVCAQYPTEAEEGFGARLQQLADTFQLEQ